METNDPLIDKFKSMSSEITSLEQKVKELRVERRLVLRKIIATTTLTGRQLAVELKMSQSRISQLSSRS